MQKNWTKIFRDAGNFLIDDHKSFVYSNVMNQSGEESLGQGKRSEYGFSYNQQTQDLGSKTPSFQHNAIAAINTSKQALEPIFMTKRCQESVGIEEKFVYKNEYVPVDLGTGIRANSPSKQTV